MPQYSNPAGQQTPDPSDEPTFLFDEELGAGYYIRVPSAFIRLPKERYSADAKVAYCVLLSYAAEKASAWPGLERLCEEVGCSHNPLRAALKELNDGGLITVRRRGQGLTNVYTLHKFYDGEINQNQVSLNRLNQNVKTGGNRSSRPSKYDKELNTEKLYTGKVKNTPISPKGDSPFSALPKAPPKSRSKAPVPATLSASQETLFDSFYAHYPNKVNRAKAREAWAKINPDKATVAAMAEGLKRWLSSAQWADGNGIAHPTTWLNGKAWLDHPVQAKKSLSKGAEKIAAGDKLVDEFVEAAHATIDVWANEAEETGKNDTIEGIDSTSNIIDGVYAEVEGAEGAGSGAPQEVSTPVWGDSQGFEPAQGKNTGAGNRPNRQGFVFSSAFAA